MSEPDSALTGNASAMYGVSVMWPMRGGGEENHSVPYLPATPINPEQPTVFPPEMPAVSFTAHVITGVLLGVFGILGALGNGLLIWVFVRSRCRYISANMLIVNLSFADLIMSVCNPLVSVAAFRGHWIYGEIGCALYSIVMGATGLVSIATMAAIAVDRYIVIARLTGDWSRFRNKRSLQNTGFVIAMLWLYSIMWNIFPLFGWGGYSVEEYGTACSYEYMTSDFNTRSYVLSLFIGGFALPLIVLCGCYGLIFFDVSQHERGMAEVARTDDIRSMRHTNSPKPEVQLAKVSATIVVFFCVAWVPYAVVTLYGAFGEPSHLSTTVQMLPAIFAKLSPIYNPIVYGTGHPVMRKYFKRLTGAKNKNSSKFLSTKHLKTYNASYDSGNNGMQLKYMKALSLSQAERKLSMEKRNRQNAHAGSPTSQSKPLLDKPDCVIESVSGGGFKHSSDSPCN